MGTSDSTSLGSSSESGELVIIEDGWTEHLKDKDSNSAVGVCTETSMPLVDLCELKSSGEDDETVATSSDCTTGSINSSIGSGIVGTTREKHLEVEDPKGYRRPTISSARKSVGKSQRISSWRSQRATVDFTYSPAKCTTTATRGRSHNLDTCKTCLF